ncbi:MAG: hypothetical protein IID45_12445 [Planctomycetes bacterium]|nr:hypothetical protein [Planctomycetota bacterium]
MKKRANAELRRDAFIRFIDSHKDIRASQPCHFGMTHLILLSTRHDEPKRLEGPPMEQVLKRL